MKILIVDTDQWSDRFANEMGKAITASFRGGSPVVTPSFGNNGYGFTAPLTDEGYEVGKRHHIAYITDNDLKKNVLDALAFYEGSRAQVDIAYYMSEKARIEENLALLEARASNTFLPFPTVQSVLVDVPFIDEDKEEQYKTRALEYAKKNEINIVGFRIDEEPIKVQSNAPIKHSDRTDLKVLINAYNERIIITTLNVDDKEDSDFSGAVGQNIGCSLRNNNRLGVSPEALELIQKVKRGRDAIGDLMGDRQQFSWIGGENMILGPKIVGSRDFNMCTNFIIIDNNVDDETKQAIDESEKGIELDFADVKFDMWLELTLDKNYVDGKYVEKDYYKVNLILQDTYIFDEKVTITNIPEGYNLKRGIYDDNDIKVKVLKDDHKAIADLLFHNIFGEKLRVPPQPVDPALETEQDKKIREMMEKFENDDFFGRGFRHGYENTIHKDVIWDYVNSFFDIGYRNNIMNPTHNHFRLSLKAPVKVLKERLRQFKLTK